MSRDYQTLWDSYKDASYYNPTQRHRYRLLTREISRIAGRSGLAKARLLDVGCGMGHLIAMLQTKFPDFTFCGVDISVKTMEQLREKKPSVKWLAADLRIPIPQVEHGQYDITVCSEVLEHLDNMRPVLDNIERLTASGGTAIITVPGGPRYRFDDDIGHLRHYNSRSELEAFFPSGAMTLVRCYRWGWPFLNLFRYVTNCFYRLAKEQFVDKDYTWKQKLLCDALYASMFLNLPNRGSQVVCLYEKRSG